MDLNNETKAVLTVLFKAALVNVVRGHFDEPTGLHCCPTLDETDPGHGDLSACDCGVKEAYRALEWCRAMGYVYELPVIGDYDSLKTTKTDAASQAREELLEGLK